MEEFNNNKILLQEEKNKLFLLYKNIEYTSFTSPTILFLSSTSVSLTQYITIYTFTHLSEFEQRKIYLNFIDERITSIREEEIKIGSLQMTYLCESLKSLLN